MLINSTIVALAGNLLIDAINVLQNYENTN